MDYQAKNKYFADVKPFVLSFRPFESELANTKFKFETSLIVESFIRHFTLINFYYNILLETFTSARIRDPDLAAIMHVGQTYIFQTAKVTVLTGTEIKKRKKVLIFRPIL